MTSPLLALFLRSLREDTRARGTYWARTALAVLMVAIMARAALSRVAGGAPGLEFFQQAIWMQAAFLTIFGLTYFASAITEEKEQDMLGLLRMTDLDPLSILLGKSTSRLCSALFLLAAQLPFSLHAATLGGVSPRQILAAYCTLGAYTFLLANLALLASVIMARTITATAATCGVLGLFGVSASVSSGLAAVSPFHRLPVIFKTGFAGPIVGFQVIANVLGGVGCLLLAALLFRVFCEHSSEGTPSAAARGWMRRGWFAPGRPRAGSAVQWKDHHFFHGGTAANSAKWLACGVLVLGAALWSWRGGGFSAADLCSALLAAAALGLMLDLGFIASRLYTTEVREQTLGGLAVLPQDLVRTFAQKSAGCWRALAPWSALLALAVLCALVSAVAGNAKGVRMLAFEDCGCLFALGFLASHLTGYLSLWMKRGALPLAVVLCLVGGYFAATALIGWFGLPFAAIVIGWKLRAKTIARLEVLAAEG